MGDFGGMHTSTASRIVARVSNTLARLRPQFIRVPETLDELRTIQNGFYALARFPNVWGTIDGTHIRIQSPGGENAEVFRNRKGYFSLNVQAVSNHNLEFLDIVARWPGSAHDSTIFNNRRIKYRVETEIMFEDILLLGDSGYPLRPYFLTLLLTPRTPAELLYNDSHIRTRNTVERLYLWVSIGQYPEHRSTTTGGPLDNQSSPVVLLVFLLRGLPLLGRQHSGTMI